MFAKVNENALPFVFSGVRGGARNFQGWSLPTSMGSYSQPVCLVHIIYSLTAGRNSYSQLMVKVTSSQGNQPWTAGVITAGQCW